MQNFYKSKAYTETNKERFCSGIPHLERQRLKSSHRCTAIAYVIYYVAYCVPAQVPFIALVGQRERHLRPVKIMDQKSPKVLPWETFCVTQPNLDWSLKNSPVNQKPEVVALAASSTTAEFKTRQYSSSYSGSVHSKATYDDISSLSSRDQVLLALAAAHHNIFDSSVDPVHR